jgi:hypothetical protein
MEATDAAHNYHPASLDAPVAHDGEDRCALAETLGNEDAGYDVPSIARLWRRAGRP